jgi:SPP1 family predicted phage head-tail adaptor
MLGGSLNRRIQIQTLTSTASADGPTSVWATAYQCWASIAVQNSQLVYSTAEFISDTTYRITLRWTSSFVFTPMQRVVYTEASTGVVHTYVIKAVVNDKAANKQIMLLCHEMGGTE